MTADILAIIPDLAGTTRAAVLAASAAFDAEADGVDPESYAALVVTALTPVIWNAALAEARKAVLDQVYVGQYMRGTPSSAAKHARDEAVDAINHTAMVAGQVRRGSLRA